MFHMILTFYLVYPRSVDEFPRICKEILLLVFFMKSLQILQNSVSLRYEDSSTN